MGVVHLGAPEFDADDRLTTAPFTLTLAAGDTPVEPDTGDAAGDGGGGKAPKGCGCAATGGAPLGGLALLLAGLARRRSGVQPHRG